MTVHIGEVISEVATAAPAAGAAGRDDTSVWERHARLAAQLAQIERDRLRTATGTER